MRTNLPYRERIIFKVQRPVYAIGGDNPMQQVFVYSKDKQHTFLGQNPDAFKMFGPDEYKIFAYGHVRDGVIFLDEKAPWQEW